MLDVQLLDNFHPYLVEQNGSDYRWIQGDHLSGKHGNVGEFDSCQGNVRDFTKNQGNVEGKNLVKEKLPKTVYFKLHICIYTGI